MEKHRMLRRCGLSAAVVATSMLGACAEPTRAPLPLHIAAAHSSAPTDIEVESIAGLYAALADPANAGHRIVLDPAGSPYKLDPTDTHASGRLELLDDMEIVGGGMDASEVIIDASHMTTTAFTTAGGLTGAIRVGRGSNALRNLTIQKASKASAGIETDLVSSSPAHVVIEGVVATGNQRGIDIRNPAGATRRVLDVQLLGNELFGNDTIQGQGLRVVNVNADGGKITVTMKKNNVHDNTVGCLIANLNSSDAAITISSQLDQFTGNGNGCVLLGGNSSALVHADRNSIDFDAQASYFTGNTGGTTPAGVQLVAGESANAGNASYNVVNFSTHGVKMSGNARPDILAYGAHTSAAQPAGTNDVVTIAVQGKPITIQHTASMPAEQAGTNRVIISQ